ncbi:MAG: hypothetical protein C0467_11675 [Planctomycetaceae bacterium]|nr:hypothetical protein [Planctomycetaceae bacterium]
MTRRVLLSLFTLTLTITLSSAADWSRFRGPNGSGAVEGEMPKLDPKAPLWKVEIPGRGAGSPIIVGGKVYLQTASKDGKTRSLLCLNATDGKKAWSKDLVGTEGHTHAKNTLASSTPACDGKQVYAVWWDGSGVSLYSYDLSGKELWRTSLGGYDSQHGPGFSPVVHEGLVFVNVDDDKRAELVAIDIKTGDKKWVKERKHVRACYSSPFILKRDDKAAPELILGTTTAITSYEPATGKVNWNYDLVWPKGKMPLRVIAHPVYVGGLLVMTSGDGGGSRYMVAVDPEAKSPAKIWELDKEVPYVPCLLAKGDLIFWIGDKKGSFACCADSKTGKVLYNERLTAIEPSASPVMVGDQILTIAENGEFVVFKATPKFDEVARGKLAGEKVFASPAVADGKLFIRGESHLYCFGKK